jgi:hypothetical protein
VGITRSIVKRVGGKTADRAIDDVATRLAGLTASTIDTAIRTRGIAIAVDADVFRLAHPELDAGAVERQLVRERARRGGATGLASGLPSIVAGPGTLVEVAAALADAVAVTYGQVSLVLALAHLRGRPVSEVEKRRLDVLLTLGLAADVVKRDGVLLDADGISIDPRTTETLAPEVVGRINRQIGERIVAKVARRRATALAGRLVPLGVGVVVAGWEDYRMLGSVGKAAIRYLDMAEAAREP